MTILCVECMADNGVGEPHLDRCHDCHADLCPHICVDARRYYIGRPRIAITCKNRSGCHARQDEQRTPVAIK